MVGRPMARFAEAGSSHPATAQKALVLVLSVTPFGLPASKDDVRRGSHSPLYRTHHATINRADDVLRERLRREKAALEREDAERADAAREQAIDNSWRCREIAELYDDSFPSFGVSTPSY